MYRDSQKIIFNKSIECPFCGNKLTSTFSKCFNIYCSGKQFSLNNWVIYRMNPELGIGEIIKKLEIPASESLDEDDTYYIEKYKVKFPNNVIKIIHPIDLIHYIFQINEEILTTEGKAIINSQEFVINDGRISYEIVFPNGKKSQISESEIIKKPTSSLDEFIHAEEISSPLEFQLKYLANLYYSYYTSHQIKCITNSRLSLMPHQINVAYRLSQQLFPRMILADEVGLGKTIEAGIYIKEMIARNLADRVLIIVPATLVGQWKFEMENKFNLTFSIYDGKKIKKLNKKGHFKHPDTLSNPFYYDNLIICSLQFARNPKYINLLSQISWDIVVFDEAHHLRRYLLNKSTGNYRETLNYVLGRNLSQSTESLLLLTATPLQLHSFELYSLIELIHPELFDNFSDFEHFRKNMPFMNLLISNLTNIEEINTFELKSTIKLLNDLNYISEKNSEKAIQLLNNSKKKEEIISLIENDHSLSQILIRNRKKNIFSDDFLNERIVKTIVVKPKKEEMEIYNQIRLYLAKIYNNSIDSKSRNIGLGFVISTLQKLLTSSKHAFLKSLERRLTQIERLKNPQLDLQHLEDEEPEYYESELEEQTIDSDLNGKHIDGQKAQFDINNQEKILRDFYHQLKKIPYDSKSEKLLELILKIYENNPKEKLIIFTQFVDTLLFLKRTLIKQNKKYHIEKFYGGMNKYQKADAVEKFRSSDRFSILLSTDIGGEGRNFQFCRVMINYDLPWNPMKLEQRIGRLDRIGQKSKEIYIYNFFMEGTIETDIIFALNRRIDLFKQSIGNLEPIIGKIEKDFKNLIFINEDQKQQKLREFNRNIESEIKKAKEMEMQLDDMLIDQKSFQAKSILVPNSCRDVKLGHNELYNFISAFFSLKNPSFGNLKNHTNQQKGSITGDTGIVEIEITEKLLNRINIKLPERYLGTFDLELARKREDIDFFALGHPLIDVILKVCISNEIGSKLSYIPIKTNLLPSQIREEMSQLDIVYWFIFRLEFQGYIIENNIASVFITNSGEEVEKIEDIIFNLDFNNVLKDDIWVEKQKFSLESENLKKSYKSALKKARYKNLDWRSEIRSLNNDIFENELKKKEKIYEYTRKSLNLKLNTLTKKLERKKNKRPTKRQMKNIHSLNDENRKEERLLEIEKLEEQISFLKEDIQKTKRKIDDLSFEYVDRINEMKKQNNSKFQETLLGVAILEFQN